MSGSLLAKGRPHLLLSSRRDEMWCGLVLSVDDCYLVLCSN